MSSEISTVLSRLEKELRDKKKKKKKKKNTVGIYIKNLDISDLDVNVETVHQSPLWTTQATIAF